MCWWRVICWYRDGSAKGSAECDPDAHWEDPIVAAQAPWTNLMTDREISVARSVGPGIADISQNSYRSSGSGEGDNAKASCVTPGGRFFCTDKNRFRFSGGCEKAALQGIVQPRRILNKFGHNFSRLEWQFVLQFHSLFAWSLTSHRPC